MKVETSSSGEQDCIQLGSCLQIHSPLSTNQNNITDKIKSKINDRLIQQNLPDLDPGDYEDCKQGYNQPNCKKKRRNKAFHLSINHSIAAFKHMQHSNIKQHVVDQYLSDMSYDELIGKHKSFQTLAYAITTVNRLQDLEQLQPQLAWKPLEVIRKKIDATTQWAQNICSYPLKDHHISRFPWNNRSRLKEDVAMDTVFAVHTGFDGSNATQVFFGLLSRCLNVYHIPSNKGGHVLKSYQDFMRFEGVPECLHRDLAPEQKIDKIIQINRDMRVRDSWSEARHPNQNPAEQGGVRISKAGVDGFYGQNRDPT